MGPHTANPLNFGIVFLAVMEVVSVTSVAQSSIVKGISYGPLPLKSSEGASQLPQDDWFCDEAAPLWGSGGRGDLRIMKDLGANLVRLYGNNPDNDHTNFLDEAHAQGLSVAPGMSDYPFYQMVPGSCLKSTSFDCFTQVKPMYLKNLHKGFLNATNSYHPALKYMNILNEPDLKMPPDADGGGVEGVYNMCRAIISAFDAMLEAEKEAGVNGPLINFTATFSFAVCLSCEFSQGKPALAQIAQLDDAMHHPEKYGYTPINDITTAYKKRFTHSFNTANPAKDVKEQFLNDYENTFPDTPVYIGEYHRVGSNQSQDLSLILEYAADSGVFLGVSFFEYQVAYWKGGSEMKFGMFGLGDFEVTSMPYFGADLPIYCLQPISSVKTGATLPAAVAYAFGGRGVDNATLCMANPRGANVTQAGYAEIASQQSTAQMELFVQHLLEHMGATVKAGSSGSLRTFAARYSSGVRADGFETMVSYLGSQPSWLAFDAQAKCVADRTATPGVVGDAIGWVCSQGHFNCTDIPPQCLGNAYSEGDYVFSRYFSMHSDSTNPLVDCSFSGAAQYAPSQTYKKWTSADYCVIGGATTTSWTTSTRTGSTGVDITSTASTDMPTVETTSVTSILTETSTVAQDKRTTSTHFLESRAVLSGRSADVLVYLGLLMGTILALD